MGNDQSKDGAGHVRLSKPTEEEKKSLSEKFITVVKGRQNEEEVDKELEKLGQIPTFEPLLRSTVTTFAIKSSETLAHVDANSAFKMARLYQNFLRQCTLAISHEQKRVETNIKTLETALSRFLYAIATKAEELKRYELRLREVNVLCENLTKLRNQISSAVETTLKLNQTLPQVARLKKISFVSQHVHVEIEGHEHLGGCGERHSIIPLSGCAASQGRRDTMEDTHVALDCLRLRFCCLDPGVHWSFYGVYDGHGGVDAAEMTAKLLHRFVIEEDMDLMEGMKKAYQLTDKIILDRSKKEGWRNGATAVTAILKENKLYVGNLGDSEMVIGSRVSKVDGKWSHEAIVMTEMHKPNDASERQRIENAGGGVFFNRVCGTLAVSRALGDADFKLPLNEGKADFVSSIPFIKEREIQAEDEFFVLACDGLWDVLNYAEVVEFVAARRDANTPPKEVAVELVDKALKRGSRDNVTVIVTFLLRKGTAAAILAGQKSLLSARSVET